MLIIFYCIHYDWFSNRGHRAPVTGFVSREKCTCTGLIYFLHAKFRIKIEIEIQRVPKR